MNDLVKGDIVWIRFPDAESGNKTIADRHMGCILRVERDVAMVIPISSLVNKEGRTKILSDSEFPLRKALHPFLAQDSFLKGHQITSVPLSWVDRKAGQCNVVGRINPNIEKGFHGMILNSLRMWDFVQDLASEYVQRSQGQSTAKDKPLHQERTRESAPAARVRYSHNEVGVTKEKRTDSRARSSQHERGR